MIENLSIPELTLFEIRARYSADCRRVDCSSVEGLYLETREIRPQLEEDVN